MNLGFALIACIASFATFGCSSSAKGKQCRAEADALTSWLGTLNLEPEIFTLDGLRLVRRVDLDRRRLADGPIVMIGSDRTIYEGHLIGEDDDLARRLVVSQQMIAGQHERGPATGLAVPDPRRLYLLIDDAAPWQRVVAAVESAHRAGFTMPIFAFTPPHGPSTRPARTTFDDRIDEIERRRVASEILPLTSPRSDSLFERCAPATRLFDQIGAMEYGDKAQALVRQIGAALVDCDCQVDLPVLRSMLWHLLNHANPVRGIEVELSRAAAPIVLPGTTPWRVASERLTTATKRAWFVVGS